MLKVTISGPCASGKTTLAQAFEEFLIAKGFKNVVVDDVDRPGELTPAQTPEHNARCLEAMSKGQRVVEIVTVQTNRAGKAYISLDEAANR